jgi:maleate cis-trans isomerase
MQPQDCTAPRLGFLVPSSNTVVEPVTYQLLQTLPRPQPSAHFARLRVVRVHSDSGAQFDNERRIEAAMSLADALCDAIVWNGTSASWLGLQQDKDLCSALASSCALPATSSSLATIAALNAMRARTYVLLTPYTDDIQASARSPQHQLQSHIQRNHKRVILSSSLSHRLAFSLTTPLAGSSVWERYICTSPSTLT